MEVFKQQIRDTLLSDDLEQYQEVVNEFLQDDSVEPLDLCAALAKMVKGNEPLFMDETNLSHHNALRSVMIATSVSIVMTAVTASAVKAPTS